MSTKFSFYIIFYFAILTINSKRNLLEEEKSKDIIILHTNDVHCGINATIGYDGVMLYKKELETKYKHVLLVDAGDHVQGGAIGFLSKGKDIIDIMNAMHYDVATIGNHEFDYKIEHLIELNKTLNSGYICANICWKNKSSIFPPYKIIELDNIKIGFIGVTTPQSFTRTYLHNLIDDEGNYEYDFLTGNNGNELYETIQNYTDELRNEKNVDYVIILSHLGYGGDVKYEFTSKGLLANIKGVDAIIDGHSHQEYNSTFKDKENKSVHIIQTGTKLNKVGKLTLKRGDNIDRNITSELIEKIPLFDDYTDKYTVNRSGINRFVDQEIYKLIDNITRKYSTKFNEEIGHTEFDLLRDNEKGVLTFFEESPLGDLITDAIKNITNTDIGMMISLFITGGIKKGTVSYKNILDLFQFSSRMIIKEIKGKDILDILELSVSNLPNPSYKFLQVSGIKFTVDENIKSPVELDDIQDFIRVNGKRRVSDVYIGNEKLDEEKVYKIATDDYISYGGGGYTMISKYNVTDDTEKVDSNILKEYINNFLEGNISDIYKSGQGRIIKKSPDTDSNSNSFIAYFSELSLVLISLLI